MFGFIQRGWNAACKFGKGVSAKAAAVVGGVGTLLGSLLSSKPAMAAIDVTAVTTGITDAQTAMVTIIGGLMALAVALFGITMVYRFVKKQN